MKGHMQDGKFHPHTDYKKGVRKSRDQKAKTQGAKLPTIRKVRDEKRITTIDSFIDAEKLGIETDGTVGTVVMGSGENYKIIGYKQGQTFSQDSISHISDFIKEYNIRVLSDSDSDFGKIFASTDKVAKMIAEDMLKPHTEFELTRVETKFIEVK